MRLKIVGSVLLATLLVCSSNAMASNSTLGKPANDVLFNTNAAVLKNHGLNDEVISQLGQEMYPLANEIKTRSLIHNYVDGIFKAKEQARKVKENREKGIVDESVHVTKEVIDGMVKLQNGHEIPIPQKIKGSSDDMSAMVTLGHGPYYNVDAKVGYNQVTHLVDLPTVKSTTPSGIIPYILGGAYVTNYNNTQYYGGADVGAFYEAGVWRLAINGKNQANTANYWTESTLTLPNGTLYFNFSVSANNTLQIIASDSNYNYITSISYWFPDINLNANGSNVEMATGFSLAYKNVASISDGSYLLNAHIYNAYVYSPSGYSQMNATVVAHAAKKGTSDEQQKISVNTISNYYNYYGSIDFR